MNRKENSKTGLIILLMLLLYLSALGNYSGSEDMYLYEKAPWLGLFDFLVCSFTLMIIPFVWRLINGSKLSLKKGKNICKWNSIILFIVSVILMISINISFIGGLGAIIYYFINKWLFVSDVEIDKQPKYIKCKNCGYNIDSRKKKCTNCGFLLDEEKIESEKEIEYQCGNCGKDVKESDKFCKNCYFIFKNESDYEVIEDETESEEEVEYQCSNCGALVKETATKCPKCGETFEGDDEPEEPLKEKKDSDIDRKYSDLTKLKKLLDKEIISKEEFEKEKKKLLNSK